ncbi:MAG: ABC transporter ATP-binding protein/permease [Bacteriovoracaceae bacterium]|nr:ABC transporter ATP-binding protein/permease [Bacteriovoracaceae bacterium]
MANQKNSKPSGYELWRIMLKPEKNFYIVSFTYACAISLLSLAIPISVQVLVNTVTFAVLMQPLIIVSLLLLALLVFSGILRGLQDIAIEYFQRHFYARSTFEVAHQLLNAKESSLKGVYRGDLVNRYFDIMTVQKKGAKLMVGGFSLVLQTVVGMLLLAFYHPYFLAFDIVLIFLLTLVWILYGKQALESAIYESKAKYKVAAWLDQMANFNKMFKTKKGREAAKSQTDKYVNQYLIKRGNHFNYLFKQIIFLLAIYALLSAMILGLGGFLVMEGQLTLGQLVAAEIVVAVILSGFAKSGDYLESVYDLHAALDKIADFMTIEEEVDKGLTELTPGNRDLIFDNVSFSRSPKTYFFNASFEMGKAYLLREDADATQRIFLGLIHDDLNPERGHIFLGQYDLEGVSPYLLREEIYVVDEPGLIEGTLEENLTWGLENISESNVNEVLDCVGLTELVRTFEHGRDTLLWPTSSLLCWGEVIRLEMAKVLLKNPTWVVISSIFQQLPSELQTTLLREFKKRKIGVIVWSAGFDKTPEGFDKELFFNSESLDKGGQS